MVASGSFSYPDIAVRTHPDLIDVVETLGPAANGVYARLKVVTITDPDITVDRLRLVDYDGYEHIAEVHRTWR